ncbi:MAG TPA: hypothetical protein VFK05_00810 [Polyangiaceae bacterium]|nr:hypothetical protein [Polyangiaceae bacterium]
MRGSEHLLEKPTAELEELLLRAARADVAPAAARERAMQRVASAALGVGLLSGTAALGSRSPLLKGTGWLVAKWLTFGAGSGLLGLGVVQGVQELSAKATASAAKPRAEGKLAAQLSPRALPLATSLSPALEASAEPAAEAADSAAPAPASTPAPALASASSPLSHEPKSPARLADSVDSRRSALTRELSLLEQVRSALALHSARSALQTLDVYQAEFPHGSMQVEAAALRIEAVGQSGDHAHAQQLAQIFLNKFPASPLAARVQAVSEVSEAGEQKP